MTVWRDVPISLTPEYVLREMGRQQSRPAHKSLAAAVEEAVAASRALVAPAAVYDDFLVRDVAGEQLILAAADPFEGDKRLTIGPKVALLAPARRAAVMVYTIGPALEARVSELYRAGQDLLAFVLDSVGVIALDVVGEALHRRVEEQAAKAAWGVGPALGPGSLVGWPLSGQQEVCDLLPLWEIGVRLNSHCVLQPHKSASMLIGLGPDYESSHVGSVCCYCALADSCWRRRGDRKAVIKIE